MEIEVTTDDGATIEFECVDSLISRWVNVPILEGKTYPYLPFVDDVRTILDAGANCGAATVHLARHYPDADVHAFEPGSLPFEYLQRNAERYPNVHVHNIGLHSADREAQLYTGADDAGQASIIRREVNEASSETIRLRSAGGWVLEHGLDRIDILKIDVEGVEIDVLVSLADLIPTVKVLYVEYDSRAARREIERLMNPDHELYIGSMFMDQGECVYVRQDYTGEDATRALVALVHARFAASQP